MTEWPVSSDDLIPELISRLEMTEHKVWELQLRLAAGEKRLNRMEAVQPLIGHSTALAYTKRWNSEHPEEQVIEHAEAMMALGRLGAHEGRRRGFHAFKKSSVQGPSVNVWPDVAWEAVWSRFMRQARFAGWVIGEAQTLPACEACQTPVRNLVLTDHGALCGPCVLTELNQRRGHS